MKNKIVISIMLVGAVCLFTISSFAHVENFLLPEECGSCHSGHGLADEPMLAHSEEELCYQCHGSSSNQADMKQSGKLLSSANLADIEQEFKKMYRHPVQKGVGHSPTEKLDGFSMTPITHAECVDCHNPHTRIDHGKDMKYEVSGVSLSGSYQEEAQYEYEVCLKCHSSQTTFDEKKKNIRLSFSLSSASQHPVTAEMPAVKSISIKSKALNFSSKMKCSDCHTNDDPDGPQGPHGSRHKYLLSGNYNTDIFSNESGYAYEFCYSCHDRTSILANESFPLHAEHIIGDPVRNIKGTSCYTCHASHSSSDHDYLIDFNPEAVSGDNDFDRIDFNSGINQGECYLNCHGHNHGPSKYTK